MDELYLILRDRADRREPGVDRRLLDRSAADRRAEDQPPAAGTAPATLRAGGYLQLVACLAAVLLGLLATLGFALAPQLFDQTYLAKIATELARGNNFALFDLNFDVRGLRREHIQRLPARPDVAVLGASHWQEAHAGLVPNRRFYNAHVHRDYYEDLLAVVEMLLRNDRLPETLVISIRDLTFASAESRTDTLWLTGLPDYRSMAVRLGIPSHSRVETGEWSRWLELVSLPFVWDNAQRWWFGDVLPGPTRERSVPGLDVITPDGSIRWSPQHLAQFTPERRRDEVGNAVDERRDRAPEIDATAVEAVDRLLGLLEERGTRLVLIHPPFNPEFYALIEGSAYAGGLDRVRAVTRQLAAAHGAVVVGDFDPAAAGCTAAMYIDSEHSNPDCLRLVLAQIPNL